MIFLQRKPQIKNMNIKYFDLYYTVIKVRNENRDTDDNYQNDENDYIDINNFTIHPNQYVGIKPRETILS